MGLGLHLAVQLAALGLADALTDDVLCGLGGDAAELLGLEGGHHTLAHLIGLADGVGLLQAQLGVGVLHLFHHVLHQVHREAPVQRVDLHQNVLVLHLVVLLDGDDDGSLDLLDQVFGGEAALLAKHVQGLKKLCVHFFCFLQF